MDVGHTDSASRGIVKIRLVGTRSHLGYAALPLEVSLQQQHVIRVRIQVLLWLELRSNGRLDCGESGPNTMRGAGPFSSGYPATVRSRCFGTTSKVRSGRRVRGEGVEVCIDLVVPPGLYCGPDVAVQAFDKETLDACLAVDGPATERVFL